MSLSDVTVLEFAGLGPVPFAGMVLAGLGADVMRIDRPGGPAIPDPMVGAVGRGKRSIALDLKQPEAVDAALRLVGHSDILLEGFRPGVMERLGIGPEACLATNPALIYGRMTGWGPDGPYAAMAGHDINYTGLSGALHAVGDAGRIAPPLNLVGDGGGAMFLVAGVLAAFSDRHRSGGTVVNAAILDGAAALMAPFYEMAGSGVWDDHRDANILDGYAPFYTTYETRDRRWMAVGPLEPHFYARLLDGLGLDSAALPAQYDRAGWPELRRRFSEAFSTRTQAEWMVKFEGTDACVTPVLSLSEAPDHPQNVARTVFDQRDDRRLPSATPRIGSNDPRDLGPNPAPGADTYEILTALGLDPAQIDELRSRGAAS